MSNIKAIVFDIGGVLETHDFHEFNAYFAKKHKIQQKLFDGLVENSTRKIS